MFPPLLIGAVAIALSGGYWAFGRSRYPEALGLSAGLLILWAASNLMRVLFPLAHGVFASPWAWTILPPAHLLLLFGGYHAAKTLRVWAIMFMSVALFLLLADAWFWASWWPLRDNVYDEATYRIFRLYNDARNWGIMVELALVAIPGGIDGALALRHRHGMDMSGARSGRV